MTKHPTPPPIPSEEDTSEEDAFFPKTREVREGDSCRGFGEVHCEGCFSPGVSKCAGVEGTSIDDPNAIHCWECTVATAADEKDRVKA